MRHAERWREGRVRDPEVAPVGRSDGSSAGRQVRGEAKQEVRRWAGRWDKRRGEERRGEERKGEVSRKVKNGWNRRRGENHLY